MTSWRSAVRVSYIPYLKRSKTILSRTAAAVAAAALFELYPGIALLGPKETTFGFSYRFFFPHPVCPETLFQIEEKMRQIIREKRPIQTLEMVPFSARELLLKEGHRFRARELEEKEELVQLAQIGPFYDLANGPLLKNTMELGAFKILSLELQGKKELFILGVARKSKAELKDFLRKWSTYSRIRHEQVGERKGFWRAAEAGILWLPPGLKLRQKLLDFWKGHLFSAAVEIENPLPALPCDIGDAIGEVIFEKSPYELETGLFRGGRQTLLQVTLFSEEKTNSLLQTIGKTLNMLGFNFHVRLTCRRGSRWRPILEQFGWNVECTSAQTERALQVDFLTEDGLNRPWEVASLRASKGEWKASVSVERSLALLIERDCCKGIIFEN